MKLKIDSKVNYDVNVHIITDTEKVEQNLKAEDTCQFTIQGSHAVLVFKECKSNFLATIVERILVIVMNYIYYCISYDDFSETRLLTGISSCIKLTIETPQDSQTFVNIQYFTDESLSNGGIDIAKVVSEQPVRVNYKLDESEFIKTERQWTKESCLYMLPAILIIVIGIYIGILNGNYFLITVMSVLFIGLTGLIWRFIHQINRKIEENMAYLKYRLEKMRTEINSKN
ncbi:hypothetical protein ACDL92_06335 [Ihubacter sp. mB4P-1]|uniref:hypothetical protein n=1 Tax=Ihubacter sp. mB4P-1 TaxID=3242370 RepID=UPI00137B265F